MATPGAGVLVAGRRKLRSGRSLVYDAAGAAGCCCGGVCVGCCGVEHHLGPCGFVQCNGPWTPDADVDFELSQCKSNNTACDDCPYTVMPTFAVQDLLVVGGQTSVACERGLGAFVDVFDRREAPGTSPGCMTNKDNPDEDLLELTYSAGWRQRMGALDPDSVRDDPADFRVTFGPKTLTGQYRRLTLSFVYRTRYKTTLGTWSDWGVVAGRVYAAVNSAGASHGHAQLDHFDNSFTRMTFGSMSASVVGGFCSGHIQASASIEGFAFEKIPGSFCQNPRGVAFTLNASAVVAGLKEC
ncbi:MAG: hypothetical protein AMXMBFR77_26730 [Phycisphaerales bacterium]